MEFRILGPAEVADDDGIRVAGAGKPTALLVRLLLSRNEVVSTDRLIDDLWGERSPRTAQKSLQTFVSQLRRALGDDAIETRPPGYVLRVADADLDASRFEELAAGGREALQRGDPEAASAMLREALTLWRGAALAGFVNERWAGAEAERLEESRLQALEARLEADLAAGRHAAVVPELEGLVSAHPLREHMLGLLMLALYRCGRQADALAAYRDGRRRLADELGLDPMPELRELEQRILRHDPTLAGRPAVEPEPPARTPPARGRRRAVAIAAVAAIGVAALLAGVAVSVSGDASSGAHLAAANSVVLVGADGRLGSQLRVGLAPTHALRAAGAIWTSNERDGSVSRVDASNRSVETIAVGNSPQALAFAHGNVWVAEGSAARVVAIDPAARKAVFAVGVGNGPTGLAARGDGLWVANSVDGTLTSIDARSTRVLRTVAVGPQPSAVAASPNAVWVALGGSGSVAELDRTGRTVLETVSVGNDPVAVAVGASGVWVANRQDGTVMRIDPVRVAVDATVRVGGPPTSLAIGDGTVWATLANGEVATIDEQTAQLRHTFPVGGSPAAAVALGDGAWVATQDATASHRGGTLRIETGQVFDCACADPVETEPGGWTIVGLVYDRLVTYRHVGGPAGSALVPDLARAVPRPSNGGRTYVFSLRRGVRFSNGRPLRAGDVRASFARLFHIKHLDIWDVPLYEHILGARTCVAGGRCDLSQGIVADDRAGTVTFHLDAPDPDFLYQLTLPYASVLPADSPRTLARRPLVGTGAYRIASLRPPGDARPGRLVLTRNPRFHPFAPDAQPRGFPDRIVVRIGAPTTAQIGAVERGASDVVTSLYLPRPTVQRLASRHASQLHADSLGATEYLFLNTRVAPFNVPAARRAVNEAVDRARLVELLGGPAVAVATCQILPPGFPGYRPYCPYGLEPSPGGAWSGPNLQRALRLVAASRTRGQRVQVWAPADHAPVALYLAGLLRLLGYRATTRILPDAHTYYTSIGDPATRAQIGWVGWIKDYTSPADFLPPLFSCSGIHTNPLDTLNYSRLCNRSLDDRIGAAGRLQGWDPVAAQQAWAAVDRSIVDRAAAVPFANDLTLTLLSPRTGGYEFNPQWGVLLDQLWVR